MEIAQSNRLNSQRDRESESNRNRPPVIDLKDVERGRKD